MAGAARAALERGTKRTAIHVGLELCHLASRAGIGAASRGRGLIFTLHHVRPHRRQNFAPNAVLEITPTFLDEAIAALLAEGYEPVALEALPEKLAEHGTERYVAFTLDDGYRDNRDHALPVFRKRGAPCTVFVTSGFIDRTCSLWWETAEQFLGKVASFTYDFGDGPETVAAATPLEKWQAFDRLGAVIRSERQDHFIETLNQAARAAGIDPFAIVSQEVMDARELKQFAADELVSLGAHTVNHPSLAHVTPERLDDELGRSAECVEEITGRRPRSFAYPSGNLHAAGPREYAAAAGFEIAVTTRPGVLTRAAMSERPTALPRVSLNGYFQKPRHVLALASGLPFRFIQG